MGSQMLEMLEAARPWKLQHFTMQHPRPWAARQPTRSQTLGTRRNGSRLRDPIRRRGERGQALARPFAARRVPLPPLPTGMRHPAELVSEALGRGDQSADAIWGDGGS